MRITLRSIILVTVMLTALLVAACGPAPATEDVSPISSPAAPTPAETPSPAAGEDEAPDMVESARAALANRLNILPQSIEVVSVEQVQWPDTSLGCPQEGEMYAQVVVPGQRVVLDAGGERYTYHVGGGNLVLCEGESATPEAGLDPEAATLIEQAKLDVSERTGIAVQDITVQSIQPMQWRDSSLGCPKPGMQYLQVITPGYLIILEAGGEVYEYHTDKNSAVYCEGSATAEGGDVSVLQELVAKARTDLAAVADVADDQIEVVETRYVEWPDASLGCPEQGQMYAQVITPGYLIRLRADGQEYEYHTTLTAVKFCEE